MGGPSIESDVHAQVVCNGVPHDQPLPIYNITRFPLLIGTQQAYTLDFRVGRACWWLVRRPFDCMQPFTKLLIDLAVWWQSGDEVRFVGNPPTSESPPKLRHRTKPGPRSMVVPEHQKHFPSISICRHRDGAAQLFYPQARFILWIFPQLQLAVVLTNSKRQASQALVPLTA